MKQPPYQLRKLGSDLGFSECLSIRGVRIPILNLDFSNQIKIGFLLTTELNGSYSIVNIATGHGNSF